MFGCVCVWGGVIACVLSIVSVFQGLLKETSHTACHYLNIDTCTVISTLQLNS